MHRFVKLPFMNRSHNITGKGALLPLVVLLALASCVPMKRVRYLQDEKQKTEAKTDFKKPEPADYRIHQGDNLYIKINSLDEKSNYFDYTGGINNYYSESAIYLNSYTVNDSGYIEFPLIGKVMVDNLTVEEIQKALQNEVDEYVKNTVVIVKLANFRISLFGEFENPGKYVIYQDKINIFEALSMAGDMTGFAKKNTILLVRQTENGLKKHRLNLNDSSILESEFYYLMPNDMIYAEPVKGKPFAFTEFPYALIFSVITTSLLLYQVFTK